MEYNLKHFAYMGDVVWELFIRELVIKKAKQQNKMHQLAIKYVNAAKQADILNLILEKLTPKEKEIQKRGRNLKITINKKNNPLIHSLATSFEVIIGYLYLTDKDRLSEILELIKNNLEELN